MMKNSSALDVCPFSSSYQQVDKYSTVDGTFYNIFTSHGMLQIIFCNLQTNITWRPQHYSRDLLPHISNTASQHDIETLFNQWDGTRRHYQVKADRTLKPMSKTEKLAQQQTLKSLDALAKISKRALWFDQALIRPPWNEAILRLDWRMGLARDPWR